MSLVLFRRPSLTALIASALLALAPALHAAEGRSPKSDGHGEARESAKGEASKGESARGESPKGGPSKADASKGESSKGESSKGEPARAEAAKAEARKVSDEPESGRRERGAKRSRESMSSDEAIEQLSTRIAEKLATMKGPEGKGDASARMVLKNPAPPRPVVRTAYTPAEVARTAAVATGQQVPSLPVARAAVEAPASGAAPAGHGAPPAGVAGVRRSAALAAASAAHAEHRHWSYGGDTGPDKWAELNPEFAKCSDGNRQSPIDIRDGIKVELDPISFEYKPAGFAVVDNGHTVQVNVGTGNAIVVNGRRFELVQFHFHRPSEERVGGRLFDMVAHLVHKDAEGRLAVVAVLIDRGTAHPVIQQVWNNLPLERGEPWVAQQPIDLSGLLPKDRGYWTYMGSLTTPPCSEGVLWMVMKQPVQVSVEQIAVFGRLYPMNARPVQQAAGRMIKESN